MKSMPDESGGRTLSDKELQLLLANGIPYNSPTGLQRLMTGLGFSMKKRFGQNFMISQGARLEILNLARIKAGELIWEIGPGLGALTHDLLGKAGLVRVFEIDFGFIRVLQSQWGNRPDFRMVSGDVLQTWPAAWAEDAMSGGPAAIIGNLPYSTGSALIADLLEAGCLAPRMVFTVQKEVAQRMAAKAGEADYSVLSIHCQARCRVSLESSLKPGSFYPSPEVTSAIVLMVPRPEPLEINNRKLFAELVRTVFAARRKTIANNLKSSSLISRYPLERLTASAEACGIELGKRGETLAPEVFAEWAKHLDYSKP